MQRWKSTGLWLALFSCVAIVGTALRDSQPGRGDETAPMQASSSTPIVRLAAMPAPGKPQSFAIDARIARDAVRRGELRIALPDGSTERIAIERHYTDDTGHWNVVGRAATRLGGIPMVLTFGGGAVFGTVPSPDGGTMAVSTAADGRVVIDAPALGVAEGEVNDVDAPPVVPASTRGKTHVIAAASLAVPNASRALSSPRPALAPTVATAAAAVDSTPVTIEVLALYSQEQVALRGSVAAVETEYANLFAVANQAHIDSGSRVRLHAARVALFGTAGTGTDAALRDLLYNDVQTGDDRNAVGADLVVMLRPDTGDGTCGRAYGASPPLRRTETYVESGQAVVNTDGACGPLSFAHETGHALGAYHDRKTSTVGGILDQPGYHFAYGHRTAGFSTIMSGTSAGGGPRVPFFANPLSTRCSPACGVADYADDVRAFNLMAPAVAAYRGTPGTASIADVEAIEPDYVDNRVRVPVRFTGRAISPGAGFHVQVVGGTATLGTDFTVPYSDAIVVQADQSATWFDLCIKPDATIEPNETIELQLVSPTGIPLERSQATVTILNDDPRPTLAGSVKFPANMPAPTDPVWVRLSDFDSPGDQITMQLMPPDYAFVLKPYYGKQLVPEIELPAPYALRRAKVAINETRGSRAWTWYPEVGVHVSGDVRQATDIPDTWTFPSIYALDVTRYEGDAVVKEVVNAQQPGNTFSLYLPRGTHATIRATPAQVGAQQGFYGIYDAAADRNIALWLDAQEYSINAWPEDRDVADTKGLPVYLNGPVPAGGAHLRCTTIDGTAKAGIDYVAMSAVVDLPAGATGMQYCGTLKILRNANHSNNWFEFEISEVSGAVLHATRARVTIPPLPLRTGGGSQIQRRQ